MIIAERVLQVAMPESLVDVPIRLYAPVQRDGCWFCKTEIVWPDRIQSLDAPGHDAFQAIDIGMRIIGTHLYVSDYHEDGQLQHWGDWKGYGFPVPENIRDLLLADDEKYF